MSSAKSILEKPLKLLTEDDISQLTREDCRKFLKDKGSITSHSLAPRMAAADTCPNRNAEAFLEQISGDPASFIPQSSL